MITDTQGITPLAFQLGKVVITSSGADILPQDEVMAALSRHATADWGDVCEEDRASNDMALEQQGRLFSVYHTKTKIKFWIITEWDRSVTTILLPDDY